MTQLTKIQHTNKQLTITQATALQSLEPAERDLIEAALSPKIHQVDQVLCLETLVEIIGYAHMISGQSVSDEKLYIHANETYSRLIEKYPDCTVEEIKKSIRNGVYGDYGDYFGLNARTFVFFMQEYLFSEHRRHALMKYHAAGIANRRKQKQVITDQDYLNWILTDYKHFKEGNAGYILFSSRKYFLLRKMGYIEFTKKEKWYSWIRKAQEARKSKAQASNDASVRNAIFRIYSEFEQSGAMPLQEYQVLVKEAMKLMYLKFFEIMVEFGINNFFTEVETINHKIEHYAG